MSYRITSSKKGLSAGNAVKITLSAAVILFGGGVAAYTILNGERPNNPKTLCPSNGPLGHVVLLVDKSDPMTFTQRKDFEVLYEEIVTRIVSKGHLLSVYALADDFEATAEPLLQLCNPGDGSDASRVNANPVQLKRVFDQKYVKPMLELRDDLVTDKPGKASPILEMVQLTGITGFRKQMAAGERRLIIVSDMIQHTPQFSMYKGVPKYEAFAETPYGMKSLADLKDVKVEFRMLLNTPAVQGEDLFNFWRQHVKQSGGHFVLHEPIKG